MTPGAVRGLCRALAALAVLGAPSLASGADPYREVSLALAQEAIALFPACEGRVVAVAGGEAYTGLGRADGLRPGMELQVFRQQGEMFHEATGQSLGFQERPLGTLRLTDVREEYSRGTLEQEGAAARVAPGDGVRISSRRLRTLLRVGGAAPGIAVGPLARALLSRGEESERFSMVDEPGWAVALAALGEPWERVRTDPGSLRRLGEASGADLLWEARIEAAPPPGIALTVRSLRSGAVLGELAARWPQAAPGPPAGTAPKRAPDDGEYFVRELLIQARSLATGNVVGEGRLEVALTDGRTIALFRWEPKALVWLWDEDGAAGRRVLSLDAADLDGDGRAEVLATFAERGRVYSQVRRWRGGALGVDASAEGIYLRAARRPGAPAQLIGQRAGVGEVLLGPVERYRLVEDSVEPAGGGALAAGISVFGVAAAPPGDAVALYALDGSGFVAGLGPDGAGLWRSADAYGGCPPPPGAGGLAAPGRRLAEGELAAAFPCRLLADPRPGGVRLAVPGNPRPDAELPAGSFAGGGAGVVLLEGPPGAPAEARRSRAFEGRVTDLARADLDGDGGADYLFLVSWSAGALVGERTRLVGWRPQDPRPAGK